MPSVSIVIPVFNSELSLGIVVAECHKVMIDQGYDYEILLVDDGSSELTWRTVNSLALSDPEVTGLRLGRNFGQHSALLAGVRAARFEYTVTIDDDLQNPPNQIPLLLSALMSNTTDVVYGVPRETAHAGWRRLSSRWVRQILTKALGVPEAADLSSFRCFKTSLREGFAVNLGPGVSLDALLAWTTNKFTSVKVNHAERMHGDSNYSLKKLMRFALDTVTGYTTLPLRIVSVLGFATAGFGFLLMFFFVLLPFFQGITIQGFPFLASTIILFAGIQLITLGVVGEYLSRMHFRVMNKPEYFVIETVTHDPI
jgi:glycosyltransferase involved in cell wall biosynthesis